MKLSSIFSTNKNLNGDRPTDLNKNVHYYPVLSCQGLSTSARLTFGDGTFFVLGLPCVL